MTDTPREAAIRVLMMPKDTNHRGTIFGGVILSHIDQAGAVGAMQAGFRQPVTVAMDKVEFHEPVQLGDLVSYFTEVIRRGRTSITIRVEVESWRRTGEKVSVTSADVTYVNVNNEGKPTPLSD